MSNEFTYPWHEAPEWAEWAATDKGGNIWWYQARPEIATESEWRLRNSLFSSLFSHNIGKCANWKNSLQKRPTIAEQPATTPTAPVSNIRLPMAEFERIADDFGLLVRDCGSYKDAAMYSPAGKVSIVFLADVPVTNITVHDEVGGMPVKIYDQI